MMGPITRNYFMYLILQLSTVVSLGQSCKDILRKLDSLLSAEERNGFHGVVLVDYKSCDLYRKGLGYANHATGLKFSASTPIQIGSNVKDFTKVAIYQLIERGELTLQSPLSSFITGLTGSKAKITVQHLLDHTAGFEISIQGDHEPLTLDEMKTYVRECKLKTEPGQESSYSNVGYSCLAYIIERVSGKSYDHYVLENIMKPLGLTQTGSYIPNFDRSKIAHGYSGTTDHGIILDLPHDQDGHLWGLRGNGGYLSIVSEMNTFYKALETDILLKSKDFRSSIYFPDGRSLAGSDMVSYFMITASPEVGRIIIGSNHSQFKGNRLVNMIRSILGGSSSENVPNGGTRQINSGMARDDLSTMSGAIPQEGFGKTIHAYIHFFNSGMVENMRFFFENYAFISPGTASIDTRLQRYAGMWGNLGKIEPLGYKKSNAGIVVMMNTENDGTVKFTFFLEDHYPFRFLAVQIGG